MIKFLGTKAMEAGLNFASEEHKYVKPVKKITDEGAMGRWQHSACAMDFCMFLVEC